MQNNLIYLSGPHGSGKTTLANKLKEFNPRIEVPELFSRHIKINTTPEYRLVLKICGRAIENFEYLEIARKNPDKIILGNRCIYDNIAYNQVYLNHDWINLEDFKCYFDYNKGFFQQENENPLAIIINPGFETVTKHLRKRWQEKEQKWKEDDLEYAKLACESYKQFQDNENILYINHEINFEKELSDINDWVEKHSLIMA